MCGRACISIKDSYLYELCEQRDAGLTQIEPGSYTVVAIGPDDEEKIDKITGREGLFPLKLL